MQTLEQVKSSFNYCMNLPKKVLFKNYNFFDWEKIIKNEIGGADDVQLVVLILPGQKGKAVNYNELKRLFLNKIPVPCQVVQSTTISKRKNF
jgi:hypothetical protein